MKGYRLSLKSCTGGTRRCAGDQFVLCRLFENLVASRLTRLSWLEKLLSGKSNQSNNVMRKPVFTVCDQVRLKPACSGSEAAQRLGLVYEVTLVNYTI